MEASPQRARPQCQGFLRLTYSCQNPMRETEPVGRSLLGSYLSLDHPPHQDHPVLGESRLKRFFHH